MAEMIPDGCGDANAAEKWVFHLLRDHLLPHDEWIVWHEPSNATTTPDFVVWSNRLGLLIVEVKAWSLEGIVAADPEQWEVKYAEGLKKTTSPLKQARDYWKQYLRKMQRHSYLRDVGGLHSGGLKFPVAYGVLFPNITRQDAFSSPFSECFSSNRILFRDDVDTSDESTQGTETLLTAFRKPFKGFLFPFEGLDTVELGALKTIMFPQARVGLTTYQTPLQESTTVIVPPTLTTAAPYMRHSDAPSSSVKVCQPDFARPVSLASRPSQVEFTVRQEVLPAYAARVPLRSRRKRWSRLRSRPMVFLAFLIFIWATLIVCARVSSWSWANQVQQWKNTVSATPKERRSTHPIRKTHRRRDPYGRSVPIY